MIRHSRNSTRTGFTLVELLVVITILLLLMSITIYSVNFARDAERVRGASSKVLSYLSGARDRAIYTKSPVGVRFFLDSEVDPGSVSGAYRTVSSAVYIDPAQTWTDGTVRLERPDTTDPPDGIADSAVVNRVAGAGTGWWELKRRGLLVDGMIIKIGEFTSPINTSLIDITQPPNAIERLIMQIPYADPGTTPVNRVEAFDDGGPSTYELTLPPRIIPSEPALLPDGVVIDLDGSSLPLAWRSVDANGDGDLLDAGENGGNFMDIVFSPRGNVIGSAASQGIIHFYVCDKEDSESLKEQRVANSHGGSLSAFTGTVNGGLRFIPADEIDPGVTGSAWVGDLAEPGEPYTVRDRRVVTVFTQTGGISVHPISPFDTSNNVTGASGADGLADDPFYFAETGEVAN